MKLFELTPEGKIVYALQKGDRTYSELRDEAGLSDRWLSMKLSVLREFKVVELRPDGRYSLNYERLFQLVEPADLSAKAVAASMELYHLPEVVSVVLYGSVAKGLVSWDSDIDFLVVTEGEPKMEELKRVIDVLMVRYEVPIEFVAVSYEEYIDHTSRKSELLFALLEGYRVMFDRGDVKEILHAKEVEVKREWVYDREVEGWVRKPLATTLKTLEIT